MCDCPNKGAAVHVVFVQPDDCLLLTNWNTDELCHLISLNNFFCQSECEAGCVEPETRINRFIMYTFYHFAQSRFKQDDSRGRLQIKKYPRYLLTWPRGSLQKMDISGIKGTNPAGGYKKVKKCFFYGNQKNYYHSSKDYQKVVDPRIGQMYLLNCILQTIVSSSENLVNHRY